MANDVSTIQSLKAVDAWIDVINANINGGVRTAFKASRLRFAGSNTTIDRAPTSTSLPLQLPEPGLITANTVIDFSQGAITSSTENTHLAIQGEGFFVIASPDMIDRDPTSATFGTPVVATNARVYLTRDGEFHTDASGLLVHSSGYYLVTLGTGIPIAYDTGAYSGFGTPMRAVLNDQAMGGTLPNGPARFSDFNGNSTFRVRNAAGVLSANVTILADVPLGKQNLRYSSFGSTVYDIGWRVTANIHTPPAGYDPSLKLTSLTSYTLLTKSLEASNSSMTQSVPELSLAQKLFSALTKVLQIGQTNTDSVLNLVR